MVKEEQEGEKRDIKKEVEEVHEEMKRDRKKKRSGIEKRGLRRYKKE